MSTATVVLENNLLLAAVFREIGGGEGGLAGNRVRARTRARGREEERESKMHSAFSLLQT